MDLRSLNTFIQVAELGSFTRAGEKLGYSQPTISLQIKQLERELGVQLFERIGHTVSLTEDGRAALSYAQRICHMSLEMMQGANQEQEPGGIIRLAMADSLCMPLIIKEIAEFRRQYPKVSLHIITTGTDEMFRLLDHNEVDIVCTLDSHIYSTSYIISNEEKIGVHFVCAANNPLAQKKDVLLEDLLKYPFVLTEKGMSYRRLLDERLARHSLEIQPMLEIGRADLICKLVEEDTGISFLPDYVTEEAVREKRIVRLEVKDFKVELWKQLLYHRDKWMSFQMKVFLEHLGKIQLQ
ncbi:MAG: LysR family transcriptional regulator [Lachnospiraceae bacterium]|nr:LysR family transcriptional regulator [Lachnospiraceae bacterium]